MDDFYAYEKPTPDPDIELQRIISIEKFIILSILTFGLYELWWIYKCWRFFGQKEKTNNWPALRALLSLFFLYSLLEKILRFSQDLGYEKEYPSAALFACFILTNLLSRLPEPFYLISIITFVFLLPPFRAFNFALRNSADVTVIEQESFSARQIILMVGGAILWLGTIAALTGMVPEVPEN